MNLNLCSGDRKHEVHKECREVLNMPEVEEKAGKESTDAELTMVCICEKCKDKGILCELKYRSKIDLGPGEAIFRLAPNFCPNTNTKADWKVIEVRVER